MKKILLVSLSLIILSACSNELEQEEKKEVRNEPLTSELVVEVEEHSPRPEEIDIDSPEILVNQQYPLPEDFEPKNLVYPNVRFLFDEMIEKRMMREDAANALEEMFAAAEEDGIYLAGVSAYRSRAVQAAIFNQYVETDGEEKAKTYSAVPGTSEHETGLAIDVSGSTGECAVSDCFANTEEAKWLEQNAYKYGYIIRYPKGKEDITGYKYEPWHIRYVGKELANELYKTNETLEEYYQVVEIEK